MPQQINLATPVLLTRKRYFSARALVQALAIFVLLGGALAAYGVWSLNTATRALAATVQGQVPELANLRSAIAANGKASESGVQGLEQQLREARLQLKERQATLLELRRGLMPAGQGHSARLQLVAQTIPPQVWVTQVRADQSQLEVSGFTQEPAALNDWVAKLAQSPLLRGQQLARIKVERVGLPAEAGGPVVVPAALGIAGAVPARLPWAFTLASALPVASGAVPGAKP